MSSLHREETFDNTIMLFFTYDKPIPPRPEERISSLLIRSDVYKSSIRWLPGTNCMEASVSSSLEPTVKTIVKLNEDPRNPPFYCAYSSFNDGYVCLHSTAVVNEKHSAFSIHRFISGRHMTTVRKTQYEKITLNLPAQQDVDNEMVHEKVLVPHGEHVMIPKEILPPLGHPDKSAGKKKKSFLERGPSSKRRRTYSCGLCYKGGHVRKDCPFGQLFGATQS